MSNAYATETMGGATGCIPTIILHVFPTRIARDNWVARLYTGGWHLQARDDDEAMRLLDEDRVCRVIIENGVSDIPSSISDHFDRRHHRTYSDGSESYDTVRED